MSNVLTIIAIGLGGWIVLFNWSTLFSQLWTDRRVSTVPLVGGLLLAFGLTGFPETQPYWWLGLVGDFGTLTIPLFIPIMFWDMWTTASVNLLHHYVSELDGRRVEIRLFKRDRFVIDSKYDPPVPDGDQGALAVSRGAVGTWSEDGSEILLEGYGGDHALRILKSNGAYRTIESGRQDEEEPAVHSLNSLLLQKLK